jgi:hypothetical protein
MGSASADPQTVTLGNVIGSTTAKVNICPAMIDCTYVPFASASNPALQVPFNGIVTSF